MIESEQLKISYSLFAHALREYSFTSHPNPIGLSAIGHYPEAWKHNVSDSTNRW